MQAEYLIENEKEIGLKIDAMTAENPQEALEFILGFLKENEELFSHSRACVLVKKKLFRLNRIMQHSEFRVRIHPFSCRI